MLNQQTEGTTNAALDRIDRVLDYLLRQSDGVKVNEARSSRPSISLSPMNEEQSSTTLYFHRNVTMITGKLEVTIKINELPFAKTIENGWQQFEVDCDGRIISVTVKPKVWKKLTDAQANYPQWVGAIAGKLGEATDNGFVLLEPNIQTFEKKAKTPAADAATAT